MCNNDSGYKNWRYGYGAAEGREALQGLWQGENEVKAVDAAFILKYYTEASGGYTKTIDVYLKEVLNVVIYNKTAPSRELYFCVLAE